MKKKLIFRVSLAVIVLLNFYSTFAQDFAESALLFSRTRPGGSARIQALAGTQIALGGDYSSSGSNPAGLGMFNRNEFTISSGITSSTAHSLYLGTPSRDNRTTFNIPGISLAFNIPSNDDRLISGTVVISMTRTNDLNRAMLLRGNNIRENSIVAYFMDQADGFTTNQFFEGEYHFNTPTGLAYYNYLIGPQSSYPNDPGPNNLYFSYVGNPQQTEETVVRGATNQWNFSYGGNYMDKLFFGAGLGLASLKYDVTKDFSEQYDNRDTIRSMNLNEQFDVRGSGINLSFGAIYRILDFVQLGVAYTTPTLYNMTDTYEASMATRWNNFQYFLPSPDQPMRLSNENASTDIITSEYNLRTPSKFSTGVAFISKFGFISADLEFTNLSNSKYSDPIQGVSYTEDNDAIRSIYKSVINYRFGAEFRYEIFRVRAGYGIQSNPYRSGFQAENKIATFSGGVGIRKSNFYIDFALVNDRVRKSYYEPYILLNPVGESPFAEMRYNRINGVITAGFTF